MSYSVDLVGSGLLFLVHKWFQTYLVLCGICLELVVEGLPDDVGFLRFVLCFQFCWYDQLCELIKAIGVPLVGASCWCISDRLSLSLSLCCYMG